MYRGQIDADNTAVPGIHVYLHRLSSNGSIADTFFGKACLHQIIHDRINGNQADIVPSGKVILPDPVRADDLRKNIHHIIMADIIYR